MKIIDLLHKIGILRMGTFSGKYRNYKEMPDELMSEGVYDHERDLVDVGKNLKKTKHIFGAYSALLFWIFVVLSVLFFIFFLFASVLLWQYIVVIILWIFEIFFWYFYRRGAISKIIPIFIFFIVAFISLMISGTGVETNNEDGKDAELAEEMDCASLVKKYDNRIFEISSAGALRGAVSLKIDSADCAYKIVWHSVFASDKIVKNNSVSTGPSTDYDYRADIVFEKEGPTPMDGNIDPVFINTDTLPLDLFNERVPYDFYLSEGVWMNTDKTAVATNFHHSMLQTGIFDESMINQIQGVKNIRIFSSTGTQDPVAEYAVDIR